MSDPANILVVCTGNICRSPVAAALLSDALPDVAVLSAGTDATAGARVEPGMLHAAGPLADRLRSHRASVLTAEHVTDATLIVAMTRAHRSAVVALEPRAVRRTFTLLELARLLPEVPPSARAATGGPGARLLDLVPFLTTRRFPHPKGPEHDDIADPFGGPRRGYARAYRAISNAVEGISLELDPLALPRPTPVPTLPPIDTWAGPTI